MHRRMWCGLYRSQHRPRPLAGRAQKVLLTYTFVDAISYFKTPLRVLAVLVIECLAVT